MIAKLPPDSSGIPLGWRFMDKFVQFPFVIPPPDPEDLDNYAASLLANYKETQIEIDKAANVLSEISPQLQGEDLKDEVKAAANKHKLSPDLHRFIEWFCWMEGHALRLWFSLLFSGLNWGTRDPFIFQ